MKLSPNDLTLMCEIEERGKQLADHIGRVQSSIEFEALSSACSSSDVDRVMSYTKQLNAVVAEYSEFQLLLRTLVARLRQQSGAAS
jgi:hypothetical protein